MKEGFYKSSKIFIPDSHAGVSFRVECYYILAYSGSYLYFFVCTGDNPTWSVFQKSQDMRKMFGEVIIDNSHLSCTILNPFLNSNLILKGRYKNDSLYLKGYNDDNPSDIWLDDTFEYIGIGEDI
jgi:hypothetical protein